MASALVQLIVGIEGELGVEIGGFYSFGNSFLRVVLGKPYRTGFCA